MHNGLSIYRTKYCKITFLALPRLSYILCNRPAVGKTTLLRQKSQQPLILTELQQNWQKLINICCSFNKISMNRKKTVLQEKFDPTINFDFFYLITWYSLMVWAWNLVCGPFKGFEQGRKILTLLTFGCPTDNWLIIVLWRRLRNNAWVLMIISDLFYVNDVTDQL